MKVRVDGPAQSGTTCVQVDVCECVGLRVIMLRCDYLDLVCVCVCECVYVVSIDLHYVWGGGGGGSRRVCECVCILLYQLNLACMCVCVWVWRGGEGERASTCTDKVLNLLIADSTPVRLCMVLSVATDASITR